MAVVLWRQTQNKRNVQKIHKDSESFIRLLRINNLSETQSFNHKIFHLYELFS